MTGGRRQAVAAALRSWRRNLRPSPREQAALGEALPELDRQLQRLEEGILRLVVLGRVGVGKSSLLNALLGDDRFATDVVHGSTREGQEAPWDLPLPHRQTVRLVDTPGLDEVGGGGRAALAQRLAEGADLVLLVLDGDLTAPELAAVEQLRRQGKPFLLVINGADRHTAADRRDLERALARRLVQLLPEPTLIWTAAAPHRPQLQADGRVRSMAGPARLGDLQQHLTQLLLLQGDLLLCLNTLGQAEAVAGRLLDLRLSLRQGAARRLIGQWAALKAAGLAASPLGWLDLAGSAAADAALVNQLCRLYGIALGPRERSRLLRRIGTNGAWIGGSQLGLQALLGGLKQMLLLMAPASAGLSLVPAAPVALAQAALAVQGSRLTGRETARQLLLGARQGPSRPATLRRRLVRDDPSAQHWLAGCRPSPAKAPLP
jgi:small GTP-binding protein